MGGSRRWTRASVPVVGVVALVVILLSLLPGTSGAGAAPAPPAGASQHPRGPIVGTMLAADESPPPHDSHTLPPQPNAKPHQNLPRHPGYAPQRTSGPDPV